MTSWPANPARLASCIFVAVVLAAGCAPATTGPSANSTSTAAPTASSTPAATSTAEAGQATPSAVTVTGTDVVYQDDFTNSASGWPSGKFDNYFIGYHEPHSFHIEIDAPNYHATVFVPGKKIVDDATLQVKGLVFSKKTAAAGDFAWGMAFRRTGDNYYAFVVSPRRQKWMLLKSSPSSLTTLAQGSDTSLHAADTDDLLQVDAQGSTLWLEINGRQVARVTDRDYTSGEVGFYVQTYDSQQVHIHYDQVVIQKFVTPQPAQPETSMLYQDDFANTGSGWPESKFDNYFIGYHEPTYYHIEIDSPSYRATVFVPGKKAFDDATIQVHALVNSKKTASAGDFAWGVAFRRSGDDYYAFVVSPRSQKWMLLKSSPNSLTTLAQGTDTSLHLADVDDLLRVDAQGSTFWLHINGRLVAQVSDKDYASGEIGFYVQTFDSQQVHIHFDDIEIQGFEAPALCKVLPSKTGVNLRSGPSWGTPFVAPLFEGQSLQPLGHSEDGNWLEVRVETSGQAGWVVSASSYVSCNIDTSTLPLVVP